MATRIAKIPVALHAEVSKLADERGISFGAALELMVARGGSAPQPSPSIPANQAQEPWEMLG